MFFHPRLLFHIGPFPSGVPIKPLSVFLFTPSCKLHSSSMMLASHCRHICLVLKGIGHYTVRVVCTGSNVHNEFHGTLKHSAYYVYHHVAS